MEILNYLQKVTDTRSHINQDYPVLDMAFLLISAPISGSKTWADIHVFRETRHETHYYVCDEQLTLSELMKACRRHWHIENSQHYVLGVTFREDEQRMYAGDSAVNIACFRRLALNLLNQHKDEKKKTKPKKMGWCAGSDNYRHELLFGNNRPSIF